MSEDVCQAMPQADGSIEMRKRIVAYLHAFNRMDLDEVMSFFAPDAVYEPGDGTRHVGRVAIRRVLSPQLSAAYGKMNFEEEELFLDAGARRALLRWRCRIDATRARSYSTRISLMMGLLRLRYGSRASYRGVDVLHVDAAGLIEAKLSYAQFGRLLLTRDGRSEGAFP